MKNKGSLRIVLAVLFTGILIITASCSSFPFKDVSSDAKYYEDVSVVYELGLMTGKDKNSFAPEETLSYGEIAVIAAKLHVLKMGSEPISEQSDYEVLYQPYVDYCKSNSIITKEYNWIASVSRAECIDIFSRAVTESDLIEKNFISDGSISDVQVSSDYYESIYKFYRAGIFQGVDEFYNCDPNGLICRYEVAEILNRLINTSERYSFVLLASDEENKVDDSEIQYDDIVIMRTPIGDLYYPGKWIGQVSSQTISSNKGYIAEIHGKTERTSLHIATFYIGTEQEEGILLGYVNNADVRFDIKNPDLSGWSEDDRITFYSMKEDVNYILKQIMNLPGYSKMVEKENEDANQGSVIPDTPKPDQGGTTTDTPKPDQEGTNTDTPKPDQGSTNTDTPKPDQGGTNTDTPKPDQGDTNTDTPKPDQGSTSPDTPNQDNGNSGSNPSDQEGDDSDNTDNEKPTQDKDENVNAPDFILLNTSIGSLYYPGRWSGKVLATPISSNQGNIFDIYCKTSSGTAKLYTIYINSGYIDGFLVGYVGNYDVRIEIFDSTLAGWSTADKDDYWNMQEAVNFIIEQITELPGYSDFAPMPDIEGDGSGSIFPPEDNEDEELYIPWENGGKQPSEYTWAEYEALNLGQQMKFQEYFGSIDLFDEWLQRVQGGTSEEEIYLPWEHGGKQPSEYSWSEFEALDPGQQMKFQEYFGSIDLFEEWRQRVQGESVEEDLYLPWEHDGKQPSEYSWAEFEALDPGQQMKFQEYFGSIDLFDEWLQRVQGGTSEDDLYLPWEHGGKQPSEYSWAEFESLDLGQQMKFQEYFGSIDLFDEWLQRVNPEA